MNWITEAINNLIINGENELFSRIELIEKDLKIDSTETSAHFYFIKLDANGNPRKKDLLQFIATKIVDYSIPKKQQQDASEYLIKYRSSLKVLELEQKAKKLFTELDKTGELGEILLYILTEDILKLPKIISKMTLKTSGKLHYQGADGIHFKYNESDDSLDLYWGESKMEKTITSALSNCFGSITPFLTDPNSYDSTQNRDLQLITANISDNINNKKLEDFLVNFFDLNSDYSNKLNFKGVCFIGFDVKNYPKKPKEKNLTNF
ncbi:DUF1837 domain-containing protein [Apibacter muscae]|uniref:HamA C-terminal domain-containing protein n=1 Tax=Apibacter muscae TaxID=2509004 RepID=UPI0011ABCBB4|nr:DUF1837 domain-containing protein [Apibacter muscae]TWP24024.1 DUF1837 domain-containing protein [Apibacter muscae]